MAGNRAEHAAIEGSKSLLREQIPLLLTSFLFSLLLFAMLRVAWVSDDAYITFRTIDNVVQGYGPRWNSFERVQAYTHPLWMLLLLPAYALSGNMYFTAIGAGFLVSGAAVAVLIFHIARSWPIAAGLLLLLLLSEACLDYSTSGLENPLSHLLLVLFIAVYFRGNWNTSHILALAGCAALAALTRMDAILLYLPMLVHVFLTRPTRNTVWLYILGFAPFLVWECFSLVYYGFPFPNTAYAKLQTGRTALELLAQGCHYFHDSLYHDPVTLTVILAALVCSLCWVGSRSIWLAIGVCLYLLYVLKIGGDFMSGRFFTLPYFAALALLTQVPPRPYAAAVLVSVLLFAAALNRDYPQRFTPGLGGPGYNVVHRHGIVDERGFYLEFTGLARWVPEKAMPDHDQFRTGLALRGRTDITLEANGIGFLGFGAGPLVRIIDVHALADPLLARLPPVQTKAWRIGHFERLRPAGYLETIRAGENRLQDPRLAEYYTHLARITQGPVWRWDRFVDIFKMNLGRYGHLIDSDRYRYPDAVEVPARIRAQGLETP